MDSLSAGEEEEEGPGNCVIRESIWGFPFCRSGKPIIDTGSNRVTGEECNFQWWSGDKTQLFT